MLEFKENSRRAMDSSKNRVFIVLFLLCFGGCVRISRKYTGFVASSIVISNSVESSASGPLDLSPKERCKGLNKGIQDQFNKKCIHNTALRDCCDAFLLRGSGTGLYWIGDLTKKGTCDMETSGGGWLTILRNLDSSRRFDRSWNKFRSGFGKPHRSYWIGLDFLHRFTEGEPAQLRVEMTNENGIIHWAEYEHFAVGAPSTEYRLRIGNYTGGTLQEDFSVHNGRAFSTKDKDNTIRKLCLKLTYGGWWYLNDGCYNVVPYGVKGAIWHNRLKQDENRFKYKIAELKIRKKRFPCFLNTDR